MADNISVTAGSGTTVSTEEVTTLNGGAVSAQHVQRIGVAAITADGTASDVTSSNPLPISAAALPLPTGAATSAKQDSEIALLTTMDASLTALTAADPAHDAADSGNPIKIGGRAKANLSGETLVAADDRTNANFALDGAQFVREIPLSDIVSGVDTDTDGSSTAVIAAQGAGIKVYVTDVTIANSSATAVTVDLRDGAAGSVKWTFPVPAGGGVTHSFKTPLPFSANTAVAADPSTAATSIVTSVSGFKSKI